MSDPRTSPPGGLLPNGAAVDALAGRLRGTLLRPGDADYEPARKVWNGMIDRRPALIVRCSGAADVMAAVDFAREQGMPLSVRGGGHNVSGNALCDDGVVVDLSHMRGVRVDPLRSTVRVAGGARLGDIDHEAQAFGLAVPVGVVSATGIGGLSLHGGMGFLTRKFGPTCDNLVAADVVTADGRLRAVDETHDPDLLWALRGGGGSFGIATSLEFRAHRVGPEVLVAMVIYPVEQADRVMKRFREVMPGAPRELTMLAIYWSAPHEEFIPKEKQGTPVLVLVGCWCGALGPGEQAIRPLREAGTPIADLSGPMPYLQAQKLFDPEYPNGRRYYWKSIYLNDLSDPVLDLLARYTANRPSPISSVDIWDLGNLSERGKGVDSPFSHRSPYLLGIEANWDDASADAANIDWARRLHDEAKRFSPGGAYLNFPGFLEEGETMLRETFGDHYDRLRKVKGTYDPGNLFQHHLKIAAKA